MLLQPYVCIGWARTACLALAQPIGVCLLSCNRHLPTVAECEGSAGSTPACNELVVDCVNSQEAPLGQPAPEGVIPLGDDQGLLVRQAQLHCYGSEASRIIAVQKAAGCILEHLYSQRPVTALYASVSQYH